MNDPDATVRIERPVPAARAASPAPPVRGPRSRVPVILAAGGLALLLGAGGAAWLWLQAPVEVEPPPKPDAPAIGQPARVASPAPTAPPVPPPASPAPTSLPAPSPVPVPAPVPAPPPTPATGLEARLPRLASEEAIRDHRATTPTLFRLAENPRIFVADFPDLETQGATLNRVAALIEKAGQPRDRVLGDAALAAAIARSGDTPATYYYGHNYRGRDLERFFALADRDGIALTEPEQWLRGQLARIRGLMPVGEDFAVVSVPGLGPRVDEAMRAAILHHEIGHGHFFTNPAFAAHVAKIWREDFTEDERARFRTFLEREGYDPANEEVMMNEAMSYLLYTPDARFFTPAHAGLDDARAEALRTALRARAPR